MNRDSLAIATGVIVAVVGLATLLWAVTDGTPAPDQPSDVKPPTPPRVAAVETTVEAEGVEARILIDAPEWGDRGESLEPLATAAQRLLFVSATAGDDGADGSEQAPWKDLQTALCRLEPGDHLIIMRGNYRLPVVIDESCKDGTPEKPIRVTATKDATLAGKRGTEGGLRINRSHWTLRGLEIHPDWAGGVAVRVDGPATDVALVHSHIRNGMGSGIVVGSGAGDIRLSHNHVHHLGKQRGSQKDRQDPPEPAAGIRILAGAGPVTLDNNNVHSILGTPLDVAPEAKAGVRLTNNAIQDNPPE